MVDPLQSEAFHQHGTEPFCWMQLTHVRTGVSHAIPTWDLRPHVFSADCACGTSDDDGLILHTSWDGRERYEMGAKAH